jgi:hypothetical protein
MDHVDAEVRTESFHLRDDRSALNLSTLPRKPASLILAVCGGVEMIRARLKASDFDEDFLTVEGIHRQPADEDVP